MRLKIGKHTNPRTAGRYNKKIRIRKKLEGTAERPRLSVFKSSTNIYAQLIDDTTGTTLAAASTVEKALKGKKV